MRVLHLLKATGIAGAETHLLVLLAGLKGQGVEVSLLVLEDPSHPVPELLQKAQVLGVNARAVPIHAHLDPALPGRLARVLGMLRFDILHAHLPHAEVYGALALPGRPQTRFVISRHSDNPFRRNLLLQLVFAPSWKRADRLIAISEAVRQSMVRFERIPTERITVIPYGLDSEEFVASAVPGRLRSELDLRDAPLVGFVGRLARPKGADTLLRAFVHVERQEPQTHLVVAGDGPWRQRLVRLGRDLGLRNVHFLGWRKDTASVLADLDLVAMPSRWEGFGLVALEAMALGKAVVATRVSALPEVVADGVTGLLAGPEDPTSLAEGILQLLQNPALARRMGEEGSRRVRQEFGVDRMITRTLHVYSQVVDQAPAGGAWSLRV